jgi:hypothetical protein
MSMRCVNEAMILIFSARTGKVAGQRQNEMVATPLHYHQPKFELAGMNTCGPAVVSVDVCFVAASQKWRRIISRNFMQSSSV